MRTALIFLTLVCACAVMAQTPDTATINGLVTDPTHAAVNGVQITVKNAQSGLERTAQTGADGSYSLSGLPVAGRYAIAAVKQGFANAVLKDVALEGGS